MIVNNRYTFLYSHLNEICKLHAIHFCIVLLNIDVSI